MSLLPEYRRCIVCGRKYSWNPDVGKFRCPYCSGTAPKNKLQEIIIALKNRKQEK